MLDKINFHFDTATDTLTSLVPVNIKCEVNILQDAMLSSYGPVWCMQSIVLTVKGGSAVTRWYFNVFRVFLVKNMQHLSEKMQFPSFLFPQVVQKHWLGEVGKYSTFWLPTFPVTFVPKIIEIEPCV